MFSVDTKGRTRQTLMLFLGQSDAFRLTWQDHNFRSAYVLLLWLMGGWFVLFDHNVKKKKKKTTATLPSTANVYTGCRKALQCF